jgi:hypothetical protein
MNLYKKDYSKLYLLQDRFFNWWIPSGLPFYLTGGTALGRFYLNHRYSEDMDFFVNADSDFQKYILFIKDKLQKEFKTDISKALVNEIDVEQRLFTFPADSLLNIDWLMKPIDIGIFGQQLRKVADDFILAGNNSLGSGKTGIEDAMIIFSQ